MTTANVDSLTLTKKTTVSDSKPEPQRKIRLSKYDGLVILVFLLAGLYLHVREWLNLDGVIPAAHPGDPQLFEWMFAHAARVVTEFDNPFFSDQLNSPNGVNLMANTALLGIGIPLAPITLLFGPHVTYVLAATLGLPVTAACWYFLLSRNVVHSRFAAFLGAGVAAFGPAMVSHNTVHLNWSFQFLLPLIVWRLIKLGESPSYRHIVRNGLILAALVVYQVFIGEEPLLFAVLAGAVFLATYAVLDKPRARQEFRAFAIGLSVAIISASLVLAYPLWYQFFGPQHYRGVPISLENLGNDAAGIPAFSTESLGGTLFGSRAVVLSHNVTEQNTFFSFGLLALLMVAVIWLWANKVIRTVAITGIIFAILSLGPQLVINNHAVGIPLPWKLFKHLPLLDHIVPTRLSLVTLACAGIIVAVLADKVLPTTFEINTWSRATIVWVVAFAAVLLPLTPTPFPVIKKSPTPQFFARGQWRDYVENGHAILPIPLPNIDNSPMRWSAETRLDLTLPLGYFIGPSPNGGSLYGAPNYPTSVLIDNVVHSGDIPLIGKKEQDAARKDLRYWRVDTVVLTPHRYHEQLQKILVALLGPGKKVSDVWVWDVRPLVKG